jgi:uncharacterized protein YndB with AHSA1/START domain
MSHSQYVYVTYIRAPREKVWEALTNSEFQKQYWFGMSQECAWTEGATWALKFSDGRVADAGKVLEVDAPRRLVLEWRNEFRAEMKKEGAARCIYELEQDGDVTKLTIVHSIARADSKFIEAVSSGWPRILSSLKSLLETGAPLPRTHSAPQT